jgi:hypothetical protein
MVALKKPKKEKSMETKVENQMREVREVRESLERDVDRCCNSAREMTLHESLRQRSGQLMRQADGQVEMAQGLQALADMLPEGITPAQQRVIRRVVNL